MSKAKVTETHKYAIKCYRERIERRYRARRERGEGGFEERIVARVKEEGKKKEEEDETAEVTKERRS